MNQMDNSAPDVAGLIEELRAAGYHYGIPMERTCAKVADALQRLSQGGEVIAYISEDFVVTVKDMEENWQPDERARFKARAIPLSALTPSARPSVGVECCVPDEGEPQFVLLGRDPQAPYLVDEWARIRSIAEPKSDKPVMARDIANRMRAYKLAHPDKGMSAVALEAALAQEWGGPHGGDESPEREEREVMRAHRAALAVPAQEGEKPKTFENMTIEELLGPDCEHCRGTGQPGGIMGGPEQGLCSYCRGSGRGPRPTPTEQPDSGETYLIRKGGAYYRPDSQGYTTSKDEAGRYTLEEAIDITHPNGPNGPRDGMSYEPAPMRAADTLTKAQALIAERDARIAELEKELEDARENEDDGLAWDALKLCKARAEALSQRLAEAERVIKRAMPILEGAPHRAAYRFDTHDAARAFLQSKEAGDEA